MNPENTRSPSGQELFERLGSGGAEMPRFQPRITQRRRVGKVWRFVFQVSTVAGIVVLALLLLTILDKSFGFVALEDRVKVESLVPEGAALETLPNEALVAILQENTSGGLFRRLERERPLEERSHANLLALIEENVIKPRVVATWPLYDSLFRRREILSEAAAEYPQARVVFRSWISPRFIASPQAPDPYLAGVRSAIFGSLYTILITILAAFPLGVGAAVYLEEYAADTWLNRVIQTNINNLAGVPSIIYGMLGLSVFVRAMANLTSGAAFGLADPGAASGRTILSAGLTLALLVLPLLIINAQEAIRAVPNSLRQASYALGATRWQTIWHHVLPNAIPGILTGAILSISRAIGETAPLVVVGASTFIPFDPSSIFSKFTSLPIQIYQWTARPQDEFRNLAAAAILVLLCLLLGLNTISVLMRNRFSRRQL